MLGIAVKSNTAGYIDLILENGVELEQKDPAKMSAAAFAGFFGSDLAVKELCDLGADMNRKSTSFPYTALRMANDRNNGNHQWYGNFPETVQALKDCGGHM